MNKVILNVTHKIIERSNITRTNYLKKITLAHEQKRRGGLGCANLAHAFAVLKSDDRMQVIAEKKKNLAIISAYNDVLSAHQPYENYPSFIRHYAQQLGATAQVASGTPAMCDGVTQGTPGMELSLFSRDVIAYSTAIGLSHEIFDAAVMLGICDKIVPGLLIGALHFGHIPCVFIPSGPMSSGISNAQKSLIREKFSQGLVDKEQLQQSESAAYHGPGTCTFYGTANSNQMLLEAMGLHIPGAAFLPISSAERIDCTKKAISAALNLANKDSYLPIGKIINEQAIVNAMVVLLATGGSTNHLIHLIAIAKSAGIIINWQDFNEISRTTPLITSIYPNGKADVNEFQNNGGPILVINHLLNAGLLHNNVLTICNKTLEHSYLDANKDLAKVLPSSDIIRTVQNPFKNTGGISLLTGNLGRSIIKTSSIPSDRFIVEAPCRVFMSQEEVIQSFQNNELNMDVIVVVKYQGPKANGMPELHKLTPLLSVLQKKGFFVALVTDGRMSGASGVIPAAIHVTPEAIDGGPIAKLIDGDIVRIDCENGSLTVLISDEELKNRSILQPHSIKSDLDWGRDLFVNFRNHVTDAESGATNW